MTPNSFLISPDLKISQNKKMLDNDNTFLFKFGQKRLKHLIFFITYEWPNKLE